MRHLLRLLGLALATLPAANAAGPVWPITDIPRFWILGEGNSHFSADGSYQFTKGNYNEEGVAIQPARMENVNYTDLRLHTGFGFTPAFSAFFQADLRSVSTLNTAGSNIPDSQNLGFGDAMLAGRFLLYRSRGTDRVYPTEWTPDSWLALVEGSWVFPLYDTAKTSKPPLGDQSNDLTGMLRLAWYANEWFAASASGGYTYRTAGYSALLPWSLRADFLFYEKAKVRFWAEFHANEALAKNAATLNPLQPDPIPGGSLLFKSQAPTLRTGTLGAAYLISREWELAVAGNITATGVASAKGAGVSLGVAWRPYQVPELRYEDYRRAQIKRLSQEPSTYRRKPVLHYGFQATVLKVSGKGNFVKIAYGRKDGVKVGDSFEIFPPDTYDGKVRTPVALARVYTARVTDSFLRVEHRYAGEETAIQPGYEVRRIILEE